jgi:hypothetical protein
MSAFSGTEAGIGKVRFTPNEDAEVLNDQYSVVEVRLLPSNDHRINVSASSMPANQK